MSTLELLAIAPQLILSLAIVLQLLLIAVKRTSVLMQLFTLASLLLAVVAHFAILPAMNSQITILFYLDSFAVAANLLILLSAVCCVLISGSYLKVSFEVDDEFYVLLLLTTLGATLLTISTHFASVFLGLELLSISLIGLMGYLRHRPQTLEASFKYLILSATASSILLFGMAMVYAYSGDMSFAFIQLTYPQLSQQSSTDSLHLLAQAGNVLILAGIAFKLSLAPFHLWTPDVYQGAPAPVTMVLATISKIAMFTVLVNFWFLSEQYTDQTLTNILAALAITSMLVGNLLALKQTNIKRLLAFSSIAHMGYLVIVLIIIAPTSVALAKQSALYYLFAYCLATLILFTFISQTSKANKEHDEDDWQHWCGLFWQSPMQGVAIIFALLSLAGIPLTAGFIGKFYLINTAVINQTWWLLASLIVGSGIGLYYYLRIIFMVLAKPHYHSMTEAQVLPTRNMVSHLLLVSFTIALLLFGLLPDLLIDGLYFL